MILIQVQQHSFEGHTSYDLAVEFSHEVRLFSIFHIINKSLYFIGICGVHEKLKAVRQITYLHSETLLSFSLVYDTTFIYRLNSHLQCNQNNSGMINQLI